MDKMAQISEMIGGLHARLAEVGRWEAMRNELQRSVDARGPKRANLRESAEILPLPRTTPTWLEAA